MAIVGVDKINDIATPTVRDVHLWHRDSRAHRGRPGKRRLPGTAVISSGKGAQSCVERVDVGEEPHMVSLVRLLDESP